MAAAVPALAFALLFLAWMTSEHFLPWVSWHSEALAFCAAALAAMVGAVRWGAARIPVPFLAAPVAFLCAMALLQWRLGQMTFGGDVLVVCLYGALALTCLTLGYCWGLRESGHRGWPPAGASDLAALAAWTFVAGGAASSLVGLIQLFDLWPNLGWVTRMPDQLRPGGNLGQPNQLATLLVLAMAATAYLHSVHRLSRSPVLAILGLLVIGLAASQSRAGALELLVLTCWWQLKRTRISPDTRWWSAPVLLVVFAVLFSAWPHFLQAVHLLVEPAQNRFTDSNANLRPALWAQVMEASLLRPWAGWGMLETAEAHNAVAHAHAQGNPLSYSHNFLLDLAIWFGWPVALLLTAVAGTWCWRRLRAESSPQGWFCLAALLAVGAHSLVEFPFAYAYFLAPCLLLLGLLEGRRGAPAMARIPGLAAFAVVGAFAATLLWSAVEYLRIEEDFRIVRFETLRIGRTPASHEIPDVVLLTQLGALLQGSRIELRPQMAASELEDLRRLALRYPWVSTQYRYALALAMNGQTTEAQRQFLVIRSQRGQRMYATVKKELAELAAGRYPELAALHLP